MLKRLLLEKRTLKGTIISFLIILYSCGGGGTQSDIGSESPSVSESSSSNQNLNTNQFLTLNIEIVENRFGKCNFGECKFE